MAVLRNQIRRHCKGILFPSSFNNKFFELRADNKYYLVEELIHKRAKNVELNTIHPTKSYLSILGQIKKLQTAHQENVKKKILSELKKLSPEGFEIFSKNFLTAYGFKNMKTTKKYKDGGIDGYGKLKVGLTYLNVAVQCKRWNNKNVGRPEIDKFRGVIQGAYEQGIFITTSSFASGATKVSSKPGAVPIILIDGSTLVDFMIEKDFGVQKENIQIYSYALDLVLSDEREG